MGILDDMKKISPELVLDESVKEGESVLTFIGKQDADVARRIKERIDGASDPGTGTSTD